MAVNCNWLSHAAKSWLDMAMYIDMRMRIVNVQRLLSQVLVAAIFSSPLRSYSDHCVLLHFCI